MMLIDPAGLQQLAQGAVQYSNLDARQWTEGNRTIQYSYDNNGSLTSKITRVTSTQTILETVTYEYNLQNKLAKVTTIAGTTEVVEYKYDPQGNRVQKTVDSVVTKYLVDNANLTGYSQVFKETTDTDSTCYIIGDEVLAQAKNTETPKYLLQDGHDSTRQLVNSAGSSILESYSYDAYGVMLGGNPGSRANPGSAQTNMLYTGEQWDKQAQMYYLRARYYDTLNGRFSQMDTFAGSPDDPQSLHKYLYCHANPVNGIDPSGLEFTMPSLLATITIMTVVACLLVTAVFGYVASKNTLPDGIVVSVGLNYGFARTGAMVQSSMLFIWDFKTNSLWWIWNPIEVGTSPIATFSTRGGKGFSLSAGFAFGMDSPNDFSGFGTVASWPLVVAKYAPFAVTKERAYNMMMLLARRNTPGTKFYKQLNTVQFGVSTSGSVYFAVGRRDNSFSWTVGYGLPAKRLAELPEWLKPVGDFLSGRLFGLRPDSYDQLIDIAGEQRSF